MTPAEAYEQARTDLKARLAEAESKVRVARGMAGEGEPPFVVIGPPSFLWEGQCEPDEPTSMTLSLYLVERVDPDRAVERLLALLPEVIAALQDVNDATVSDAVPTVYPSGATDLPAYQLTAEMTL